MCRVLRFCIVPLVRGECADKHGSIKYGGENCHGLAKVEVPAVLLLEMTSA